MAAMFCRHFRHAVNHKAGACGWALNGGISGGLSPQNPALPETAGSGTPRASLSGRFLDQIGINGRGNAPSDVLVPVGT